ncbi:MAG: hypothetical protein OEO20_16570 [Gemmatimonadota bacterium]|nr:hypothetical protein [Gemmatimonadota bacterium]MDH3571271.1 hypothetical protein [Gemmatimonadota bacterium]MDH5551442.1 hypothetical protein [Gemmatimonadota bacterium]
MSFAENTSIVLVDCHVHYHAVYDVDTFFDSALTNFRSAATGQGVSERSEYVLMLSESAGRDYFAVFGAAAREVHAERWRFRRTREAVSLLAQCADGASLTLVAGRQIAVSGGLEVLALGTDRHYRDGGDFFDTINQVLDDGALAVVPWGFGKWWFRRGHRVAQAIRALHGRAFFLGDNGGRLRYGSPPALFEEGRAVGVWTLPGSDPLPLRNHQTRAGSYGCTLNAPLDPARPAASLMEQLASASDQPPIYGELRSLADFCVAQAAMQVRKRLALG